MWYTWTIGWWWLAICQYWLGHSGCLWFTCLSVNHCLVMFCLRAGIYSFNPCWRHSSRILHGKHFLMIIFFFVGENFKLLADSSSFQCVMHDVFTSYYSLHSLAMRARCKIFFTLVQNWFCPWCAFSHAPCLSKVLKKKQLNYLFGTWHIDWIISTKQFSEDIFGSGCLEKCYCISWHSISVCASLLKHLWYC